MCVLLTYSAQKLSLNAVFRSAHTAGASGITHERQPNFRHRKKKEKKENRKIERGEFITPPRSTGRWSNKPLVFFQDIHG